MPTNLVKTKHDEKLWKMAQKRASSQYSVKKDKDQYWAITTGIYKRMKGSPKEASIVSIKLDKSDFLKLARNVAEEYFDKEDNNLTDIVVKTALIKEMNDAQIETLCSTSNQVIHAALQKEKSAEEDQSITFDMARPEDVVIKIADLCETPDDVYMNANSIFLKSEVPEEKEADDSNYGIELQKMVRTGQILRQNIKNIAAAYNKIATDLMMEEDKTDEATERLYALIRQAVEQGKEPSILKDALGKAFDDATNFELVWGDIEDRLIADGIVKREALDIDRGDSLTEVENWAPNKGLPIIATASKIDERITRMRRLNTTILGLEKMSEVAVKDLEDNLVIEKDAFAAGAVLKGIGSWGKKLIMKKPAGIVKGAVKKSKLKKGLIPAGFAGVDYVTAAGPKVTRLGRR